MLNNNGDVNILIYDLMEMAIGLPFLNDISCLYYT